MNNKQLEQQRSQQANQEVPTPEASMSYAEFERLLKLRKDLAKPLHPLPPGDHLIIRKAIAVLDRRTKDAPGAFWDKFNEEVKKGRLVG